MGGDDSSTEFRNWVHESTDLITWTQIDSAPWSGRRGHQGIVVKNKLYIMGGAEGSGVYQNDLWEYDGHNWGELKPQHDWPAARAMFSAFVTDGQINI